MKIRSFLRSNPGKCLVLVLLLVLAAGSMLWSLKLGSLRLSAAQILETLWNQTGGIRYQIVCNIRLPRILCGALVGAALAVSGAILQGVMRNPLAAPGIIGVSAGGGLAGILAPVPCHGAERQQARQQAHQQAHQHLPPTGDNAYSPS